MTQDIVLPAVHAHTHGGLSFTGRPCDPFVGLGLRQPMSLQGQGVCPLLCACRRMGVSDQLAGGTRCGLGMVPGSQGASACPPHHPLAASTLPSRAPTQPGLGSASGCWIHKACLYCTKSGRSTVGSSYSPRAGLPRPASSLRAPRGVPSKPICPHCASPPSQAHPVLRDLPQAELGTKHSL